VGYEVDEVNKPKRATKQPQGLAAKPRLSPESGGFRSSSTITTSTVTGKSLGHEIATGKQVIFDHENGDDVWTYLKPSDEVWLRYHVEKESRKHIVIDRDTMRDALVIACEAGRPIMGNILKETT